MSTVEGGGDQLCQPLAMALVRVTSPKNANQMMKLLQRSKATFFNLQVQWPTQSEVTDHVPFSLSINRPICNSLTSLTLEKVIFDQLEFLPPASSHV
jgi:hypothetical protein